MQSSSFPGYNRGNCCDGKSYSLRKNKSSVRGRVRGVAVRRSEGGHRRARGCSAAPRTTMGTLTCSCSGGGSAVGVPRTASYNGVPSNPLPLETAPPCPVSVRFFLAPTPGIPDDVCVRAGSGEIEYPPPYFWPPPSYGPKGRGLLGTPLYDAVLGTPTALPPPLHEQVNVPIVVRGAALHPRARRWPPSLRRTATPRTRPRTELLFFRRE
eukprot:gene12739-biopygen18512